MKACPDRYESLLLDVYGELDPVERPLLEQHLASCLGCRDERQYLLRLLDRIREEMPARELSADKARVMSLSVRRGLVEEKGSLPWWKGLFVSPTRLIPALAAACLVVVSVGWFSLKTLQGPVLEQRRNLNPEKQMIQNDFEVISNLDFLQDLDVVNELVRVVDEKEIL